MTHKRGLQRERLPIDQPDPLQPDQLLIRRDTHLRSYLVVDNYMEVEDFGCGGESPLLCVLGEAGQVAQLILHPRLNNKRSPPLLADQEPLVDQFRQGPPDRHPAGAVALLQLALGRKTPVGIELPRGDPRAQDLLELVVQRNRALPIQSPWCRYLLIRHIICTIIARRERKVKHARQPGRDGLVQKQISSQKVGGNQRKVQMNTSFDLARPAVVPPLDGGFRPAVLANRAFQHADAGGDLPLIFALERADGAVSRYETRVFPEGNPRSTANLAYAERVFKFLLWQRGGWRAYIGGPKRIGEQIRECYSPTGARAFDCRFMGEEVYARPFTVLPCALSDLPAEKESAISLGRHLDGCRIGFDLGASDRKVVAAVDGKVVFSKEVVWEPGVQSDPEYHYREIIGALRRAASFMPRVAGIGGSAAGVYVDNKVRVASLFRAVPAERYALVRDLFMRIGDEIGVPLVIVNDGDVAALAGAMSLAADGILGIALGPSEAAGYVSTAGTITGWLNELAFAPVNYNPQAPRDEWSGDRGCGAQYLSQQAVFRLARASGIAIPRGLTPADRLRFVQGLLEGGDERAVKIWESIGVYLGYAIAHYASFYKIDHLLILGRCTSGMGGELTLERAAAVLRTDFPALAERIGLHLPDEKSRRVGQAIAAASLPALDPKG